MPGYGVNDVQETSGGYSPNDVLADQKKPEGGFAPAVKKATGQAVKSIGQLASDYIPGVSKDNAVSKYGQSVIDANPTVVHGFSDVPDNKIKTLTEGAGMAAGSVGGVLATQALGGGLQLVPNPIVKAIGKGISKYGPWAAMTIPAYGEIREQQINEDPGMEHSAKGKLSALAGAGAVGAIESKFGPESWASSAFTKEGRKKIAEAFAAKTLPGAVAKGGVRGALVEGAEELVQSPIQQIAAFQDPTTRKNLEETAFGGFMGAVGGGAFGGGVGAASRLSGQGEAQVAQQQGQPTEDQTRLLGEQEAIQTPSGYAENADELAKAQAHAANIYAERDAFEQDQMERNGLNPANIQAEFGEDITAQPVPSEIARQQFVNNMPPPSYLEWAQNMDIADFINGFPIRSADMSMTLASILRGPFADQEKEQAAERLWNLGQQSRIPTPESLPSDAGPIAKAAAMGTVTGAVQTNQYGMHVQPDMPQKGLRDGATNQGGKVSPMVAQGDQSQGANLPGSGSVAQPDLSSGLAGRSGGTGIPGATDGSAVSVGDAGVQGVASESITPAMTLPESAPAPVTQLAQPTMGSEFEKTVTSSPSQIKSIQAQPITQPGKSITQRGENIVVLGYPREALENARSTLHANAVIDQKGQAIFRAGTDMNALKEALNPGTAYIPEASALKAEDFPMYVKGGKFSQARAHTFAKKFGAKSFDGKQEAEVYAEALRNGEGGNWVAKKHLGKWRAVAGESNAQDAGKTEAYEAEAIDDQGVYGGKGQPASMGESESAMVSAVPASATESASAQDTVGKTEGVAKKNKPRMAENAKDLHAAIKKAASGIVHEGKILYPAINAVGVGGVFRMNIDGTFERFSNGGMGVKKATRQEIEDLEDSIEKDRVQVELRSHWGGSGNDTGTKSVKVLHSPTGLSFQPLRKAEQETVEVTPPADTKTDEVSTPEEAKRDKVNVRQPDNKQPATPTTTRDTVSLSGAEDKKPATSTETTAGKPVATTEAKTVKFARRKSEIDEFTRSENFKVWSNNAPLVTSEQADTYTFKTGERVVVEAFHGTKRPDRVGTKFLKKRATSGPMAFFTSDPTLASSYAQGKSDTSLAMEEQHYATWFKWKPPGSRSKVDIVRAWYYLDNETKQKIREIAPTLRADDDGNVVAEEGNKTGNGSYDYNLDNTARKSFMRQGNPLEALVEDWLNSGNLYNNEETFLDVLAKIGFPKDVEYDSPFAEYPFVYKTYVVMQSPLVTTDVPQSVKDALNTEAKRDRTRAKPIGSDMWDKGSRTLREWVNEFNNEDNTYVWTSIPDKVTEVFRGLGFDGIIDKSGKGGGAVHPVYIPFDETQVKSAIGNKGTYDRNKNDVMFSRRPAFFSPLSRAFETSRQDAMPAKQWQLWLNGNKAKLGLKDDELHFSGVLDYLDLRGKDKVTKGEIAEYLSGNGVTVHDVVKGDVPPMSLADERRFNELMSVPRDDRSADDIEWMESLRESATDNNKPKFSGYWESSYKGGIPGTYREILVTLPQRVPEHEFASIGQMKAWLANNPRADLDGVSDLDAFKAINKERRKAGKQPKAFQSQHWQEPNVLVHIRLDEVTGADGKRYVRVGEIQSDWGQKGKKEGFGAGPKTPKLEIIQDGKSFTVIRDGQAIVATSSRERAEAVVDRERAKLADGIPTAPFVTDTKAWVALGIKRAIMHAVDVGAEGVVFGTGQQNADLYDLSKRISRIVLDDNSSGSGVVPPRMDGEFKAGTIYAYDLDGKQVIDKYVRSQDELADVIGKESAEKLIAAPASVNRGVNQTRRKEISGIDLVVGGAGMRAFYDSIVPSVANEVLRKVGIGGKVVSIETEGGKQPGFAITQEAREKLTEQGLPLFARTNDATQSVPYTDTKASPEDKAAIDKLNSTLQRYFGNDKHGLVPFSGRDTDVSRAFSEEIRSLFKTRVIFVQPKSGSGLFNGFQISGLDAIFVDGTSDAGFIQIAGHELWHHIETTRPDLAKWYGEQAKLYIKDLPAYRNRLNSLLQQGEEAYTDAGAESELLADFLGDSLSDPDFLQRLASSNESKFKRLITSVRMWLGNLAYKMRGLKSSRHIGDVRALQKYLADVLDAYAEGKEIAGVSAPKFQRVYHGTPHIWAPEPGFPHGRPRLDKMGTGEGEQAYGWGWYSAESHGVGKSYKDKLGVASLSYASAATASRIEEIRKEIPVVVDTVEKEFKDGESVLSIEKTLRHYSFSNKTNPYGGEFEKHKGDLFEEIADLLRNGEFTPVSSGILYQLDIPDATLPYLLDWDRPLSEQTKEVRDALAKDDYLSRMPQSISGADAYALLSAKAKPGVDYALQLRGVGGQKAASEYLASLGIVGNRYLDGQSRNRPLKDIKREFLEELPEDAGFAEVTDLIGTGSFSPKNNAMLAALRDDDWLGFDYPAQAISAALSNDLNGYDASPALLRAVEDAKEGATFNFVIWHQPTLDKIAMLERNGEKLDAMRESVRMSRSGDTNPVDGKERTANRKAFLDGSKVRHVVYHASIGDFDVFDTTGRSDLGAHFGTIEQANNVFKNRNGGKGSVIPVWLSLKNPLRLKDVGSFHADGIADQLERKGLLPKGEGKRIIKEIDGDWKLRKKYDPMLRQIIKDAGHDGIVYSNTAPGEGSGDSYIAFDPNQIKSAIGNTGAFDASNPDIRYSRKDPKRFNLEPETSAGEIQRKLQDNANVIKEVQNAIKLQGGKVTVSEDVYHAMERMTDTAAWRMETFVKETVEPLMKRAAAIKTNTEEIGTYLMALGAKDRNAYISTIRQDMPNNGSGMEDSEAQTIVDDYKQRPDFAEFDKLARDFQAITERKLNLLIDGGVITEDQAAEMKDAFGFYVPYKGFETVDEAGDFVGGNGIGSGYSTSKRMSKRAYGRISRASDVVENIIRDYNGAIFLAEKAKVGETLERLVDANPDSTLWTKDTAKSPTLGHTPTKYEIQYKGKKSLTMNSLADAKKFIGNQKNKGDFTIQRIGGDPKVQYRDLGFDNTKEVRFIRDGKDVRIQIHHPLFIAAYNKLNNAQLNAFLEASSNLNSFLRQMYTQKNPVFIFKNAMRDVQTGYMVLTGEQGNEFANKSMLRVPKSFKNLLSYTKKGTTGNAVEDAWYKKMREWGGGNSFAYMEDVEAQKLKLEELLAKHGGDGIVAEWKKSWATQGNVLTKVIKSTTNASKLALYRLLDTEVLRAIENINMSVENAIRLSAFREYAERNGGLNASNEVFAEASRIAKNVTVNFNRKGEFTPVMNSLYLFWNANVQGTQNIYRSATDTTHKKQVQAIMAGLATMGFLMGMATGDDDDELSSEFDKHHNALIHAGDSVWKIPLAYGLGFFFGAGYTLGNLVRGRRTYGEATLELAGMALEHFSPLGTPIHDNDVDVKDVAVMASPTIFKPLTMSAVNKNTFGTALVPHYSETDKKLDSETMYRATRGTLYDQAANNVLTKWADVSPETLKMLTNYMTGGVGGIVADSVGIVANPAINMMNGVDLDEGFDVEKLPVIKSFHSVQDVEEKRGRFYKQLEDADDKLSTKSFVDDKGRKHKGREARIRGRSLSSWRRSMAELRDAERDARNAREFDKARRIEEEQVRLAESLDKSTR